MTKTELIKRAVQDAGEPFSVEVFKECTMVKLPIYEHSKYIEKFHEYCPDWLYDYLLNKAIEGVNHNESLFEISMVFDSYIVKDFREGLFCDPKTKVFLIKSNADYAKESALTYIYDQEGKR